MMPMRRAAMFRSRRSRADSRRAIAPGSPRARGFTLVELMVGLLISLLCTLAMFKAFAGFEGQKRTTTSGNDAQQNGSYSLFQLERQIRSAGSGLTQGNRYNVWGCAITAYSSSTQRLPRPSTATLPDPFSGWPGTTRAMPVLIQSGGTGPDTIAVVAGNPAVRTFKTKVGSTPDASTVAIDSTSDNVTGISRDEYLLASDSSGNDCTLTRVASGPTSVDSATNKITLSAADSPATGLTKAFSGQGYLFDLGTTPAFTLFGVNNNTLVSYDLLQRDSGNTTSIAEGITQIKALYGIDNGSGGLTWVLPTGDWAMDKLTTDAATAATAYSKIKAVRVAVVAQSLLRERDQPTSASGPGIDPGYTGTTSLTLFGDLDVSLQINVATQEHYRYKVYDTTIPVRGSFINKFF